MRDSEWHARLGMAALHAGGGGVFGAMASRNGHAACGLHRDFWSRTLLGHGVKNEQDSERRGADGGATCDPSEKKRKFVYWIGL